MELFAGGKVAVALAEQARLDREELPTGRLVGVLGPHVFPQHLPYKSRYAALAFRRLNADPLISSG
jgi:hypothetical protein